MSRYYTLLCSLIFTIVSSYSCKTEADKLSYNPPVFPLEHHAEITKLNDDLVTTIPNHIMLCDSVAVLAAGSAENDRHFQIVSLNDGRFIDAFGYVGRGPKELKSYKHLDFDAKRNLIFAIDNNGKSITINLNRALLGRDDYVVDCWQMPTIRRSNITYHLGNRLLHAECSPCSRFFTTTINGLDTLNRYEEYPSITKFLNDNKQCKINYFRNHSVSAIKPDRTQLVNITGWGMVMEIFNIADGQVSSKLAHRFYRPQTDESDTEIFKGDKNNVIGGIQAYATDKYIYALYYDTVGADDDFFKNTLPPHIGVFDWQGREVCRYTFKNDHIMTFAVTPDDKRCYCWVMNADGEEYLGYFDLK